MTNKEALLAQINIEVKDSAVELVLLNNGINGSQQYAPANQQAVETALAGLIFILATNPKSISDLDFSITNPDVDALLKLRSIILTRYNLPDELAYKAPIIQDATQWWGTTDYE